MREGQIHKDWKDETVEKEKIKKRNIWEIIFIIFTVIVVFVCIILTIRAHDTSSTDESSYSIINESKHKVALIVIDDQLIEYEYSWAITTNTSVNIKLKDGTKLETSVNNVFLFEYDGDECESLNEIRNKLM